MGRIKKSKQTSASGKKENQKIESKNHTPSANKCKENKKNLQQVKDKINKKFNQSKKSEKTTKISDISASEKRACRKDAVRKMCKIQSDGRARTTQDQSFCYKKCEQAGQDRPQPSRVRKSCKEKDPKTGELYAGRLIDRKKGKLLHSRHHAKQPEHDDAYFGREFEHLKPGSSRMRNAGDMNGQFWDETKR